MKKLITIAEFCNDFGVKRTRAYELLRKRDVEGKKIGRSTRIVVESAETWAKSLPDYIQPAITGCEITQESEPSGLTPHMGRVDFDPVHDQPDKALARKN